MAFYTSKDWRHSDAADLAKITASIADVKQTKSTRSVRVPSTGTSTSLPATSNTDSEYTRGILVVGGITVLFSSNSPAMHAALSTVDHSPPVLALNALVSAVALVTLLAGWPLLDRVGASRTPAAIAVTATTEFDRTALAAGAELGLWKFLGTTANLFGLSLTSSDHGAFLIQLTTLLVPLAQAVMGVPIPRRIWGAIALALTGVALFTQDPDASGTSLAGDALCALAASLYATYDLRLFSLGKRVGDALCALAASLYATYDLRLFSLGKRVAPLPLISTKIAVQAVLSSALACALVSPEELSSFISSSDPQGLATVGALALWSGVAVNAVAPVLQVGGQQAVGAARAQVIYASQPLWASLIAWAALGEM
eukprot:CAMPEP_0206064082 /NCGR_PEP_ID=MMETSP1466-20131121/58552_1 /ASSEMBLY_ACC=CAM_ASM_001126 /TAXON_ID=44452 /ORGANISM="Pavlova gyrans, Strain CCMP608" /LENGTH=369 /DNA_ID=CAMNT_0053439455 /DNA_START=29 /DNA_END=1136 /DNA_ORIENTATION=+